MEHIQITATLPSIALADLAEFKRLADEALELAEAAVAFQPTVYSFFQGK